LETLTVDFLVKDAPSAIAVLDTNLKFVSCSDVWLEDFDIDKKDIESKGFSTIFKEVPISLQKALQDCLNGKNQINKGQRFSLPSGKIQWLKWKINSWKDANDNVLGLFISLEDITEKEREKELLLKAEEVSKVGGWEVNLTKSEVYWSKATKSIHEVPNDYIPNLEQGINFYKEGEHRETITRLVTRAITEGEPWDTELIIITAKGNEVWVRAKGEAEMVNGKCARLFGTFQNIDEKKKAEIRYQKIAERLKIATQNANIGIWEYDIVNNSLIWDDNMYNLYGLNKDDFSGEYAAWEAGVHPEDKERGTQEIDLAISGVKEFDTEFRVLWPDGTVKNIKALATTERDSNDNATKMIGVNWDITELIHTRLKLERHEESFSKTFKNATTGMALVAKDGSWIRVNNGICKSFGYTKKELLQLTFQDITHPDDLNKDLELLQEVLEHKRDSYQLEKRYFHKKGNIVYSILTVTAVKDIDNTISHFISQIVDITPRIEAEKKLKTLVDVTKSQNDSLLNFAHIVSHNLRSHSTNMTMLTKFLGEEKKEEERENLHGMLINASSSLSETIEHLNDVVQAKTGALEKMQSVNLLNTFEKIERGIRGLIAEQNAISKVNIDKSHFVEVVPAYLESILLNLYTNALKYRAPNRSPIIEISTSLDNDSIIIEFKDNGQGIDLERHKDKIFGMYKTFHRNKDAKGIGLFITKNQIEAMNGTITVKSTVGEGSTFCIKLNKG
jgi:PAS domain S-box-containing protein